uniref:AlkB homolog 2, alpha-ketoglutarate-dependent dioxygenase n=1 Tax=Sinocyclocheilus rhinocerous TaxID=307959 RepID=A0A673L0X8_9TELE
MSKFVIRRRKRSAVEADEWKTEEPFKKYKEECEVEEEFSQPIPWQKIEAEGLDCDCSLLFDKEEADHLFNQLEDEVEYFTCDKAKLQVYGKSYSVPRKQATYGDEGLMYSFSGVHLLAKPWTPTLEHIRDAVTKATGHTFNFVLINRYNDGRAARDFIFRHKDARTGSSKRQIEPVKLELAHGSLLLMNYPTNTYWYHSLPVRKKVKMPRINLTFRRIVKNK